VICGLAWIASLIASYPRGGRPPQSRLPWIAAAFVAALIAYGLAMRWTQGGQTPFLSVFRTVLLILIVASLAEGLLAAHANNFFFDNMPASSRVFSRSAPRLGSSDDSALPAGRAIGTDASRHPEGRADACGADHSGDRHRAVS